MKDTRKITTIKARVSPPNHVRAPTGERGYPLYPHEEQLQSLVKEYLKTSRMLTILHLQKFLSMKLQWQSHTTIQLTDCVPVEDGIMPKSLDPELTLEKVYKELTNINRLRMTSEGTCKVGRGGIY